MKWLVMIALITAASAVFAANSKLLVLAPVVHHTLLDNPLPETSIPPIKGRPTQSNSGSDDAHDNQRNRSLITITEGSVPANPLYVEATCEGKYYNGECKKGWWTKFLTDPNAIFAFFLTIFALLQVMIGAGTAVILRQTKEVMREQHALIQDIESPNPFISEVKAVGYINENVIEPVGDRVTNGSILPAFFRILFLVGNSGRHSAVIREFNAKWIVTSALPIDPDRVPIIPSGYEIPAGQYIWFRLDPYLSVFLPEEQRIAIHEGRLGLWAYGSYSYIRYGIRRREIGFLWKWDVSLGFVTDPRPGYTYEIDSEDRRRSA